MWFIFALLSAIFASLTSILAKIGIDGVNSNLATAITTVGREPALQSRCFIYRLRIFSGFRFSVGRRRYRYGFTANDRYVAHPFFCPEDVRRTGSVG